MKLKALTCACVIGAMAQAAYAAKTGKDVSKEISELRDTIISADVLLTPRGLESRAGLTEEELRQVACKYKVTEKKDLDALLDVLATTGIVAQAPDEDIDARTGIYLNTSNGVVVQLVFGVEYNNAPARGVFNRMTPVVAKKGFDAGLRAWAAGKEPVKQSISCQR